MLNCLRLCWVVQVANVAFLEVLHIVCVVYVYIFSLSLVVSCVPVSFALFYVVFWLCSVA